MESFETCFAEKKILLYTWVLFFLCQWSTLGSFTAAKISDRIVEKEDKLLQFSSEYTHIYILGKFLIVCEEYCYTTYVHPCISRIVYVFIKEKLGGRI